MVDDLLPGMPAGPLDRGRAAALAEAALDTGREDEAVGPVETAAWRVGTDPALWQWTALLHRSLDRRDEALRAFLIAERLAPSDARIAHGLARTRLEAGLPAIEAFERARRLAPHDGELLLGRAAAQCAAGETTTAIAQLEATLALTPEWFAGHETVARLRFQQGDGSGFTASTLRAIAQRPGNVTLRRTLLTLLDHAGRHEEVLSAAAEARRVIGDHRVMIAHEAIALSELRRDDEADAAFARLATVPDPTIRIREVRHLLRTGRPDRAAAVAEDMLGAAAEELAWPYLAAAWRLTGDPRAAWLEGDERLVGSFDIAADLPPLDRLAETLRRLHGFRHQPLDQSLRGGTQTDGSLFDRIEPDIVALRAAVAKAVERYIRQLPAIDDRHPLLRHRRDRRVRFAGSWSVRLTNAGFHANHNHPAGWLSSALYLALPERHAGDPPHAGWLTLGQPQAELRLPLSAARRIEPRPGRLVLFPSTMWHGTLPFAEGERLTVAFDVAAPPP